MARVVRSTEVSTALRPGELDQLIFITTFFFRAVRPTELSTTLRPGLLGQLN